MNIAQATTPAKPIDLNHRTVVANRGLNAAHGVSQTTNTLDTKHGIARAMNLENAKMAAHLDASPRAGFSQVLNDQKSNQKPLSAEKTRQLEQKSQTLVNQFFMGSMLKSMRDSPFKSDVFDGGKGGAAYAGLFDQRLAEHSGSKIAKGLVRSMVKQYSRVESASKMGVNA